MNTTKQLVFSWTTLAQSKRLNLEGTIECVVWFVIWIWLTSNEHDDKAISRRSFVVSQSRIQYTSCCVSLSHIRSLAMVSNSRIGNSRIYRDVGCQVCFRTCLWCLVRSCSSRSLSWFMKVSESILSY